MSTLRDTNASSKRQRSEGKLDGGGGKPRPGGPLVWAAYIHAGLSAGSFGGFCSKRWRSLYSSMAGGVGSKAQWSD